MTPIDSTTQPGLNRWWFVVTGFLTLLFGTTSVNVLFNIVGEPMSAEFGWDRSTISNGLSIETVFVGISIVALGFLIDRFGPRLPSVPMALVFGIGLMAMAALPPSKVLFYLLCVLIGAGAGAVNPVAHSTVVSAWFKDHRGLALGILMAGLGACGVLMPYLANWVLSWGNWRLTFLIVGALCTVIPAGVYAFVTRMPETHDAKRLAARAQGTTAGESLWTIAKKYRQFWLLSFSIFLVSSATFGLMSAVVPMTTDKGVAQAAAVTALSILSLSSVGARVVTGFLLDRIYAPIVAASIFALCGLGVYLLISSSSPGVIIVGAALVGLGLGAEGDVLAYMCTRYFPQHSYGRVLGFIYFLYAQGSAFGIFLLGQIFQAAGSYQTAVLPIIGLVIAAIVCLLFMGPYRYALDHKVLKPSSSKPEGIESEPDSVPHN
ncbi:Sugar phosphate permease [Brevibacterium sandarakinum]|uniref:Sugar phosphate permease n=1 Tax=Brevibacterium sandarakinum TaxID=629680 RepID=A0A1H1SL04_BRESA|nr:MFS transporter [Brevibacterium sandarakinum]SDS48710.1 Sugar phosphate permease [Brevibacterium sandarakinum]